MRTIQRVASITGVCHPDEFMVTGLEYPFVQGSLVGTERAFLKFRSHSACEVVGFQVAACLGVPVPRTVGIWSEEEGVLGKHNPYQPYRIGVVIEFLPDLRNLAFLAAAEQFPDLAARVAALGVLSRDEWGEVGVTPDGPTVFDFDFMCGLVVPEDLMACSPQDRRTELESIEDGYSRLDKPHIEKVLDEACSLSIADAAVGHLRFMCRWNQRRRRAAVEIAGHPLARVLSAFQARLVGRRLNAAAQMLSENRQPLPDWRKAL